MKNKAKKILAGLGLGLVGAMTLTGCSMSDEQQAALDKVVDKTDKIIELVEKNNKKLEREDAVLLYKFALTRLQLNKDNVWDNMIVDATYNSDGTGHYVTHFYKLSNGKNVVYSIEDNDVFNFHDSTENAGIPETPPGQLTSGAKGSFEYYAYSAAVATLGGVSIDVTLNNLVDCVVLENGNYLLTCVDKGALLGYDDIEYIYECEISEDGVIYGMNYHILEKQNVGETFLKMDFEFTSAKILYKYGELTENIVQANIDSLNS